MVIKSALWCYFWKKSFSLLKCAETNEGTQTFFIQEYLLDRCFKHLSLIYIKKKKKGQKILQSQYLWQHFLVLLLPEVSIQATGIPTISIWIMLGMGKSESCFSTSKKLTFKTLCERFLHPIESHLFIFKLPRDFLRKTLFLWKFSTDPTLADWQSQVHLNLKAAGQCKREVQHVMQTGRAGAQPVTRSWLLTPDL